MKLDLQAILKKGEDNFVERKPANVNAGDIRKACVAFANALSPSDTGYLLIGVLDDGSIQHVENPDSLQKKIRRCLERECYPPIEHACEILSVGAEQVLVVSVSGGKRKPHFAGLPYFRRGSQSTIASSEMVQDWLNQRISKAGEIISWGDEIITVEFPSEMQKPIAYKEYRVEKCDAHRVTVYSLSYRSHTTIPLEQVIIDRDDAKHRNKLAITNTEKTPL